MVPLRTFYRMPIPVFEPHEENVLACPADVMYRLRDDAGLQVRLYTDEVLVDRVLRAHLGEELQQFGESVMGECVRLDARLDVAERLLVGQGVEFASGSRYESPGTDNISYGDNAPASDGTNAPLAIKDKGHVSDVPRPKGLAAQVPGHFGIVQTDPPIGFRSDFRGELIDTIFGTAQTWTFSFGSWYYRLKRWLFSQPQWKKFYRLNQIDNLSISQELLTGVIGAVENVTVYPMHDCAISDVDAAACIMAAYHAGLGDPNMPAYSDTVDVMRNLSKILSALSDDIAAELGQSSGNAQANYFAYKDPSDMRFYAPMQNGRHYVNGTFDDHVVIKVLLRRGVVVKIVGHAAAVADAVVSERLSGQARDDLLFTWTRRLLTARLGRDVPVFAHEQQYLRSGLTAVTSMLLLWRVLNSESVFSPRKGRFMLSDILGDAANIPQVQEAQFASSAVKNFEYVIHNYVVRWYQRDNSVTLSQLFPGLILLCVADSVRGGWDPRHRGSSGPVGVSGASDVITVHSGRVDPVAEYMFAQSSKRNDTERLEAHDRVLFHYENGLGKILSVTLTRHRVSALASSLFNVVDIYETTYFMVFGFLPTMMVA